MSTMDEIKLQFTFSELRQTVTLLDLLHQHLNSEITVADERMVRQQIIEAIEAGAITRDVFGLNPVLHALQTAYICVEEIGVGRDGVLSVLLYTSLHTADFELLARHYGAGVAHIVRGLVRIEELYRKTPIVESENFRNLLISFSEDMRVILIMIADRVCLMRQIRDTKREHERHQVSLEASYLYAPLAHKLGLYKLKSELEDLSLKYLEHDAYYMIKDKLNATKAARDAYIERFIGPVRQRLQEAGLRFHMKGRTKSIHSIWQKMKKQKCEFEGIYDLFAIRIILDAPKDKEKMQCWQAYSIVTDMYQPNPKRLRDWLSVPKSNGYESLHITVLGPERKWVEVQIRTERMDEVAERGLAAHWRYKGVQSEGGIDEWLANIRTALETGDDLQLMDQFKLDLYDDEIYVFTPKGDLFKFPKGATVLDFAYRIHSDVGNSCVGGRVNGKVVSFRQQLHSGDTVAVITQSGQQPKVGWLAVAKTAKAKAKIRLALKETTSGNALYAKEMLERRFRNRKIEIDESVMGQLVRKLGYKEMSDFYRDVADNHLDPTTIVDKYTELRERQQATANKPVQSAGEFALEHSEEQKVAASTDVLVIDKDLKGIEYSLAKCCQPIYGDAIFGFVTAGGGIKIHRTNCPNAPELLRRFGYRVVPARWSGKGTGHYAITLRVIGNDDIGIVSNITNMISKEEGLTMRSINIDSHDGLFRGNLVVLIDDTTHTEQLMRKLRAIKGIKQVDRISGN